MCDRGTFDSLKKRTKALKSDNIRNGRLTIKAPKPRNPMAVELASGKYGHRIVKAKKGKGSFSRNKKAIYTDD